MDNLNQTSLKRKHENYPASNSTHGFDRKLNHLCQQIINPKYKDHPKNNPTQCLTQLFMSNELVDLTVIIPNHNGIDNRFKVHRLVLGMWSCVFKAMLFGPMTEGDTITLKEESPESFGWVLMYMYTGQTELSSVKLAIQVYLLANKYLMRHLKTVCSKLYIKQKAIRVIDLKGTTALMNNQAILEEEGKKVKNLAFFGRVLIQNLIFAEFMTLFLKFSAFSNKIIFRLLHWSKIQLKFKELEFTTNTLRQEIEKFLPHIRFLAMSAEEFVKEVLPESILTLHEVTAIQLNIAGVKDVSLPPLLSNNKKRRKIFYLSELKKCKIENTGFIIDLEFNKRTILDPDILHLVQTQSIIHVNKLEYENNVGYKGTLTVKDSSRKVLRTVQFDGQVAEFYVPLTMQPGEKYTFTLSGGGSVLTYVDSKDIQNNGLISGQMMNRYFTTCFFHYWKCL
ncbi:unnamed protein product, partial [Meganyctiphanes norvegica]